MEKRTLSQFVWTLIMLMILLVIVLISTPLGRSLSNAFINGVNDFTLRMKVFMPIKYDEVVQEGDWEFIVIGSANSNSSEFTDADRDEVGMIPAIRLTKYIGNNHRQIVIPNIYVDADGKKYIVDSIGGLQDGDAYIEEKACVFNEYTKNVKNIVVAQGVDIYIGAFNSLPELETVIIADKCETINDYAFSGCRNLQNVRCGTDNAYIGSYAFANCVKLDNVHFGENLYEIGDFAFYNCAKFVPISKFPDTLNSIGNNAFMNCESLDTIDLDNTQLVKIGDFAFAECESVSGTIYLPDTLEYIGASAFTDCKKISGQLVIPKNLKVIGDNSFMGLKFNKIDFSKNTSIKVIGNNAFMNCNEMNGGLIFPSTLEYIGQNAFYGNSFISNIVLPENLRFIGSYAFYRCGGSSAGHSRLKNFILIIPSSCEYLGGTLNYDAATDTATFLDTDTINAFNETYTNFVVAENNPNFVVSNNQIIYK